MSAISSEPSDPANPTGPMWQELRSSDPNDHRKVWVFRWIEDHFIVRQEFHDALLSIIRWLTDLKEERRTELSFTRSDDVGKHATYPNPFKDSQPHLTAGVVITGPPGIGKSAFLHYLVALRVAMNLPTLFASGQQVYFWENGHLFLGTMPLNQGLLAIRIPQDTWILVDSNNTPFSYTSSVPEELYNLRRFIVQAASPRMQRMGWMSKVDYPLTYFTMEEFSSEELMLAIKIRRPIAPDMDCVREFHRKFGGSCRDVFQHGFTQSDMQLFESSLREKASLLSIRELEDLIHLKNHPVPVSDGISHALVSAFPIGDWNRGHFTKRSPSPTIAQIVFDAYSRYHENNKRETFEALMQLKGGGRSVAAYYYDTHFHTYLLRADSLKCYPMKPPHRKRGLGQTTRFWTSTWEPSIQAPLTLSLRLPGTGPIPHLDFSIESPLTIQPRTYYCPTTRTMPTFDSFFASTPTHAVVFQASIALTHDVNKKGLYWLHERGIRTMEYVYISPTLHDDVTIPFPASVPDLLEYPGLDYELVVRPSSNAGPSDAAHTSTSNAEVNDEDDQDIPKIVAIYHAILDVSDPPKETRHRRLVKTLPSEAGGSSLPQPLPKRARKGQRKGKGKGKQEGV
ncbi:hypothetical protein GGU11DRAFT_466713 [Lentinula aff. detonsa]|nr:hypothetical protein GGU11DRAFT_466713 [Lentinula aff. detonsa]